MIIPTARPSLRRLAFSDRIGASVAAMRNSFDRGVELPESRADYRGAGKKLTWDDDTPIVGAVTVRQKG